MLLDLDKINPKVKAIVNMVIKKKAAGVPIDGIGTQAHLDVRRALCLPIDLSLNCSL